MIADRLSQNFKKKFFFLVLEGFIPESIPRMCATGFEALGHQLRVNDQDIIIAANSVGKLLKNHKKNGYFRRHDDDGRRS